MWSGRGTFSVRRNSRSDLGRGACADHDDCDQKRDQTAQELHRMPPLGWLTCSSRCVTFIETGVGSGTSRSTPGPSPAEPRCGRASWRMTGRGPETLDLADPAPDRHGPPFSAKGIVPMDLWVVKDASRRSKMGNFWGPCILGAPSRQLPCAWLPSTRGGRIVCVLASRASAGQRRLSAPGV